MQVTLTQLDWINLQHGLIPEKDHCDQSNGFLCQLQMAHV